MKDVIQSIDVTHPEVCEDCVMPAISSETIANTRPCVKCPFCGQVVTAILTPTEIKCPNCLAVAKR